MVRQSGYRLTFYPASDTKYYIYVNDIHEFAGDYPIDLDAYADQEVEETADAILFDSICDFRDIWPEISVRKYSYSLDDFVEKNCIEKVDFIKADIEGAERLLLIGSKKVLQEHEPMLSICTYHLPDDPEVLERLILKANARYVIEHKWNKLYAYVPR